MDYFGMPSKIVFAAIVVLLAGAFAWRPGMLKYIAVRNLGELNVSSRVVIIVRIMSAIISTYALSAIAAYYLLGVDIGI